jgi:hypothetical protein
MRIRTSYITTLLAAGAAAVAIAGAPSAAAADPESCSGYGSGSICQSPGNVQLNDSPPPVNFDPYGGEGFLMGGFGGFHGGFHGGGHGGGHGR